MNDYLEFKEHFEHAFIPAARAAEYMKKDVNSRVGVNASAIRRYAQDYLATEEQVKARIAELNKNLGKSSSSDSTIRSAIQREKDKLAKAAKTTRLNILNTSKSTMGSFVGKGYKQYTFSDKIPNAIHPALQDIYQFPINDIDKFGRSIKTIATLLSNAQHDDLEHGWFTDLFKKKPTYTATGSTAGMPSNIPVGRDTSSAAASSFTEQLSKLTNNLYQYELEERKSKEAYERYRKLVNDTKKEISRVEKLRNNAVANSLTAVQKPVHTDKPAKYQHLPQGSRAGMPTNIPRKK